ncbi:MAG: RDD family protein [Burkholderiales bacterium]|nr:RDD family protein [Burkholderiales bacterium]
MFGQHKKSLEMPADPGAAAGGAVVYAGFWARFAAMMVDSAIIMIIGIVLIVLLSMAMGGVGAVIGNIAFVILQFLYWPVMESSARQATFGKRLMGLQVTDLEGGPTSFIKSLLRNLAKILSALILCIGFLMAAFTGRKQALHDMMTGCLVVRTGPSGFLKAILATVLALAIAGYGGYYYLSRVYMPQLTSGMQGTLEHHDKVAREMPKSVPAPKPAPKPAAAPAPEKSTSAPAAGGSQDYDRLLATPLSGIDKPSSTRAGAAIVHLDTQFNDSFWLRVLMPTLPGLERGRVSVTIRQVLDAKGVDHYDRGSPFEKGTFVNVTLSPVKTGVPHLSGTRSVRVTKGTAKPDVHKVEGVLHLELPMNMQQATAGSGDAGKELAVGPIKATLKSFEGDKVSIAISGDPGNYLGAAGYDAQGAEVPVRSTARSGNLHTYGFAAPVARVELFAAAELLKRDYPFTVTRGGTAAATASAPAAVAAADKPAVLAAAPVAATPPPVPSRPAASDVEVPAAQAPVAGARRAPREAAPRPVPAPAPRAETPAPVLASPPTGPAPKYNDVMSAVMNRDPAGAAEVLAIGVWVDRSDSNGNTPLMIAAELGDAAMVQLLLKHGADHSRIGRGGSVLSHAQRSRDSKTIDLLLKAGAR